MIDVSVVIPTFNRAADLNELLGCLARQRLDPNLTWEVVAVDNASTDHTSRVLKEWEGKLPLKAEFEPVRGSSSARNRGILAARGPLIVFADSDILVGTEWLQSFVDAANEQAAFSYFGGLQKNRYEHPPPSWYVGAGQGSQSYTQVGGAVRPSTHLCGANWACRAAPLRAVGLFDARLGPANLPGNERRIVGNDAELMDRLIAAGHRGLLLTAHQAVAETKVSAEEMRLRYVVSWHFGLGRGEALRSLPPRQGERRFPLWRIRLALADVARLCRAALLFDRPRAARALMQIAVSAGYLRQSWSVARRARIE